MSGAYRGVARTLNVRNARRLADGGSRQRPEFNRPRRKNALESVLPEARKIASFGYRIPDQEIDDILQQAATNSGACSLGSVGTAGLMVVIPRRCLDS
jgi:hypothetical protein